MKSKTQIIENQKRERRTSNAGLRTPQHTALYVNLELYILHPMPLMGTRSSAFSTQTVYFKLEALNSKHKSLVAQSVLGLYRTFPRNASRRSGTDPERTAIDNLVPRDNVQYDPRTRCPGLPASRASRASAPRSQPRIQRQLRPKSSAKMATDWALTR